jgi:hypothetical protein
MNTITPSFAPSKRTTSQEEVSLVFSLLVGISLGRSRLEFWISITQNILIFSMLAIFSAHDHPVKEKQDSNRLKPQLSKKEPLRHEGT